ncbi:putative thymidylate synthase [Organic Lake phycodnavirus 1]|jgi:thymidylate synthase (FAD)|nr:putative thymidylate synthase [Organic Lake phycodnavirus 1]
MKVTLISHSQTERGTSISDIVSYCARVSNPANQNNTETNEKLIDYLIKHNHWSPFEMVNICLEIETTRDIGRQILRHRSFSFQEFSQRYAISNLGFECREARLQDTKNRQNSISTDNDILNNEWCEKQNKVAELAQENYEWALTNGIAKEQARSVLPEGMTMSRLYMNGTLRSWMHYIQLRCGNGTQKEHREVALACANVIDSIFPISKLLDTIK